MNSELSYAAKSLEELWAERLGKRKLYAPVFSFLAALEEIGHTCLPWSQRISLWNQLTDEPLPEAFLPDTMPQELTEIAKDSQLKFPLVIINADHDQILCFTRMHRRMEEINQVLYRLNASRKADLVITPSWGWEKLSSEQKDCVKAAMESQFFIMTGGPGTGKTTTIFQILVQKLIQNPQLTFALCAPTGRAAARLGEGIIQGFEALKKNADQLPNEILSLKKAVPLTLHRLLGKKRNQLNEKLSLQKLSYDLIIIDEASMLDEQILHDFLMQLDSSSQCILAGDPHQLPSVEAGAVLKHLLRKKSISHFELKQNHRLQNQSSANKLQALYQNCLHAPASETLALFEEKPEDLSQYARWDSSPQTKHIIPLWEKIFTLNHGKFLYCCADYSSLEKALASQENPLDLLKEGIILTPYRNGLWGVKQVNQEIAKYQNYDPDEPYAGLPWIINSNLPRLGLSNGDRGLIFQIGHEKIVVFPRYPKNLLVPLVFLLQDGEASWAMTVHKSQGSEFSKVAFVLPDRENKEAAPSKELVYTALTRTRNQLLVLAGSKALELALNKETLRYSLLGMKEAEK